MEKFTIPEVNFICIFAGETKAETISNIMDGIPSMDEAELVEIAEQSIIKLDEITESEFDEMNFTEHFIGE
jgi:phage terminase Nu1 subunit (DNA packaging protein)